MSDENQVNAEGLIDSSAEQAPISGEVTNNELNNNEQSSSNAGGESSSSESQVLNESSADTITGTSNADGNEKASSDTEIPVDGTDGTGEESNADPKVIDTIINESSDATTSKQQDEVQYETLSPVVYPSEEQTIIVEKNDEYGGAHTYHLFNSRGFNNGVAEYTNTSQKIQFVQKNADGSIIEGVQSEQLAYVLLDRIDKLAAVYPHVYVDDMRRGLYIFLDACKKRIDERLSRNVMGELKE